jgi:hypothetical protein
MSGDIVRRGFTSRPSARSHRAPGCPDGTREACAGPSESSRDPAPGRIVRRNLDPYAVALGDPNVVDVQAAATLGEHGAAMGARKVFDGVKAAPTAFCNDPLENEKVAVAGASLDCQFFCLDSTGRLIRSRSAIGRFAFELADEDLSTPRARGGSRVFKTSRVGLDVASAARRPRSRSALPGRPLSMLRARRRRAGRLAYRCRRTHRRPVLRGGATGWSRRETE